MGRVALILLCFRCGDGELIGCHAVVLAASSPVLRRALEEVTTNSEELAMVLMPDFTSLEVGNLLNMLYTGTSNHTEDLTLLLKLLKVDTRKVKSDKATVKLFDDVKEETKEVYEDEDSYFHGGLDFGPMDDVTEEHTVEDGELPIREMTKKITERPRKENSHFKPDVKEEAKYAVEFEEDFSNFDSETKMKESMSSETSEDEWNPKKGKMKKKKSATTKSDGEVKDIISNSSQAVLNPKELEDVFKKQVNREVLIKQINENPDQSLKKMEQAGVQIYHFPCAHCNEAFGEVFQYSNHVNSTHPEKMETFNEKYRCYLCFWCDKTFLSQADRKEHLKEEHEEKYAGNPHVDSVRSRRKYICPYCNKEWKQKNNLKKLESFLEHVMRHEIGKGALWCERCPQKFDTLKTLRSHINNGHLSAEMVCSECGFGCANKEGFRNHMRKHNAVKSVKKVGKKVEEEDKVHVCEICAVVCPTYKGLYNHKALQHPKKQFHCETCGQAFNNKKKLELHVLLHKPPTMPCHVCAKFFHNEVYLKKHVRSQHTAASDSPFPCEQCGKHFTTANNLAQHMNVHLGIKPFKCRYCQNCYQNLSNALCHEKKSHPELYQRMTKNKKERIQVKLHDV